jgi:hypothetical protein
LAGVVRVRRGRGEAWVCAVVRPSRRRHCVTASRQREHRSATAGLRSRHISRGISWPHVLRGRGARRRPPRARPEPSAVAPRSKPLAAGWSRPGGASGAWPSPRGLPRAIPRVGEWALNPLARTTARVRMGRLAH